MISHHRLRPSTVYQPSVSSWYDTEFELLCDGLLSDRIDGEIADNRKQLEDAVVDFMASRSVDEVASVFAAQLLFHDQISTLYVDPIVQRIIPGISACSQAASIRRCMSNSGFLDSTHAGTVRVLPSGLINRLGWLYVAQCTDIGSFAFVANACTQKVKHEPSAKSHRFPAEICTERKHIIINKINQLALSEVDEDRIFAGARAAFGVLQRTMKEALNGSLSSHWKGQ